MTKAKHSFHPIAAWADRFNAPTVDRLVAGLAHVSTSPFRQARRMLHEVGLLNESVAWHGESWKWTVEFRAFTAGPCSAMLVPAPENVQLVIPVTREFLQALPMKRLKKAIREGLELASEPFDTHLAVWPLVAGPAMADLHDLLHRRVKHLARKTG